ncbi:putative protein (plasmid) [Methanobacterium congolense]|uniref:4Fe-4S ferredoxin-type domain-containing protein n=1 Tax=Methanobacterium congolense TaxID=118062 RepID=A0A1D3L5L4_9EURY|nr:putative protein [Methanobacterium congolense]
MALLHGPGGTPIKDLESAALQLVTEKCDPESSVVMFSGGKDSLVALDIASKAGVEHAVFIDSDLEFSISRDYVRKMKKFYDIEFVQPVNDFFEFCERISPPSKRLKWCCKVMKLALMMDYGIKNQKFTFLTGLRSDESRRRSKYTEIVSDPFLFSNPRYTFKQVNPVLLWSEREIWQYIHENELPFNPLYKLGSPRVGCWCCPLASRQEWDLARDLEPEKMKKLKKLIRDFSLKLPARYRHKYVKNGWKSFAFKYHKNPVMKMSIPNKTYTLVARDFYLDKVEDLLFILSSKFQRRSGSLSFDLDVDLQKQQIRMLLEKSLNCVGCGVCLVLCPVGALYLDPKIKVDSSKCVGCFACCKRVDSKLKMGCVARNYRMSRNTIEF